MNWKFKAGFAAVLLGCLSALTFGATGDITQCVIDPTGNFAFLKITGEAPGGTYSPGTTTANFKTVFTVTSPGYANGVAVTKTRTVYGTHQGLMPTGDGSIAMSKVMVGAVTNGPFLNGKTVSQAGGATAVVDSNCPASPLLLRNITGSPNSTDAWTDSTTGATATPTTTPTTYTGRPVREGVDGSDLWICLSLSQSIYQKDNTGAGNSGTAPTVTIAAGLYNDGTHSSNAVTALVCTNESTLAFPKVKGGWAIEGGLSFTGSLDLEMFGCQEFATNQEPLDCVVFSTTDSHSHTTSTTVTAMALSSATSASSIKVPVYKTTITAATYTQLDSVVCNWKAYPVIGDSSCVLDTSAGAGYPQYNATGPPALGPINFLCNKNSAQIQPVAVVDSTSNIAGTIGGAGSFVDREVLTQGTSGATAHVIGAQSGSPIKVSLIVGTPDATHVWTGTGGGTITPSGTPTANASGGTVYADASLVPGSPGTYASLSVAAANLAIYNNANFAHNDPGNGIIWMVAQDYGTGDQTSAFICAQWLTITRKPGVPNGQAVIVGELALNQLGPTLVRYYDLDFKPIDDYCVSDNYGVWFDSDRIDGTADVNAKLSFQSARLITTNCTSQKLLFPSIPFGGGNFPLMMRGNNFTGVSATGSSQLTLGNIFKQDSSVTSQLAGPGAADGSIFAYNSCQVYGQAYVAQTATTQGIGFISNLIEKVGADAGVATSFWADGNTANSNGACIWNNTIAGQRSNSFYVDEVSPAPAVRSNISMRGNSFAWCPTKHDAFNQTNGGEGPDPRRITGSSSAYGVGYAHNNSEQVSDPDPGIYFGIDGTRATAAGYTNDASATGTGLGGGNYVASNTSSLLARVPFADQPMAFDLAGNTRSLSSTAIGAFAAASESTATAFELSGGATATPGVSWLGSVTPNGPLPQAETVTVTDDLGNTIATLNFANGSSTAQNFNWTPTGAQSGSRTLTATASPTLGTAPTLGVNVAPVAPTGLNAAGSTAQINLSWTAVNGASSYNVYRGTTPGGESGTALATGINTTSYSDTGLAGGQTYYYTIKAVNAGGTSPASNEASATTTAEVFIASGSLKPGDTSKTISLSDGYATWTAGTPGTPTFTISKVPTNDATIVSQTVAGSTTATLTVNAGATVGVITVTDPSTGMSATIPVSNAAGPQRIRIGIGIGF